MNDDALLQVSRWTREAEADVRRRAMAQQSVEEFEHPAWLRFAGEEVGRLLAVALFVAVITLCAVAFQS